MKKILALTILSVLILLAFASCKSKDKVDVNNETGNNGTTDDGKTDTDVGDSEKPSVDFEQLGLVYTDLAFREEVDSLMIAINDSFGTIPMVMKDSSAALDKEIVFGITSRPVSEEAYRLLDRLERNEDSEVGYVIYSDGSSIAIAFDDDPAGLNSVAKIAMQVFINDCLEKFMSGSYSKGVVASSAFDLIEYQEALDAPAVDKAWSDLALAIGDGGDEIVEAMKVLYSLSTDDLISWFANLYAR